MTPEELKALQERTMKAIEEYDKLEVERNVWVRARTETIKKEADAIFKERLSKLADEKISLERELRQALNEKSVNESVSELSFPEGAIMIKDKDAPKPWNMWTNTLDRMEKGVLEVFRAGDPIRENRGRYSREPVGMVIVRQIRKDGQKGKLYVSYRDTKQVWKFTGQRHPG